MKRIGKKMRVKAKCCKCEKEKFVCCSSSSDSEDGSLKGPLCKECCPKHRETPHDHAREIDNHIQTACSEVAHDEHGYTTKGDCAADDLYSDDGFVSDLVGDRIYDIQGVDNEFRAKVCEELKKIMPDISSSMWDDLAARFRRLAK
ncbi:MAG: hypothetical protein KAS32_19360 [Candidatus Peribacteraceae bacterium]|nr:hypothetical protein [Candidatus Peribacteraceae bacterium]